MARRRPGRGPELTEAGSTRVFWIGLGCWAAGFCWHWSRQSVWFLAHRPLFELARATDPGSSYYGAELPWGLPFLSSTGQASGSPEGADKYGMICSAPTDLGRGWWMCGLAGSGL